MPGLVAVSFLIFRTHLARVWTSRRALAAIPPIVAALAARFDRHNTPATIAVNLGWLLLLQVIVPLVTLVAGSAVVAEEIEDRTITYLFSRPIPRASLLF